LGSTRKESLALGRPAPARVTAKKVVVGSRTIFNASCDFHYIVEIGDSEVIAIISE